MNGLILFLVLIIPIGYFILRPKKAVTTPMPATDAQLLEEHVPFYQHLSKEDQLVFQQKVMDFLSYVRVHGVNTTITELDKLLVASSAVIPIFHFTNWRYHNLTDVLLYKDSFDADNFSTVEGNRNTLGMVGSGAMQRMMILSQPALRQGFKNEKDKNNTGIHEFVHLLDKEDGATDGIPEALLGKQYALPWLKFMSEEISEIKKGHSDINVYGATNHAEFFAVASEYFFKQPAQFKEHHPELYELMEKAFGSQIV